MSDLDLYKGNLSISGRYRQILVKYLYIIRLKKKKVFAASFPLIDQEKQREKSSLRLRAPTDFKPQKTPDPNSCLQESAME